MKEGTGRCYVYYGCDIESLVLKPVSITPAQEVVYVIGAGVHMWVYGICVCGPQKIFESYFSDRLTFSNIHDRTFRRIYRLALPL